MFRKIERNGVILLVEVDLILRLLLDEVGSLFKSGVMAFIAGIAVLSIGLCD